MMRCEQELCHNWGGGDSCVRDWMDCPEPEERGSKPFRCAEHSEADWDLCDMHCAPEDED